MPLVGKDRVKRGLRDRADKLVRGVGLEAASRLIRRTPVDKGRARGNWNVAIGEMDRSHDESILDPQGAEALRMAQATILGEFRAGQTLFVTNSLPYVPELDRGHSKQAPQGMVALTVAEMQPLVGQVLAEVRNG